MKTLLLAVGLAGGVQLPGMEIIAHRGASFDAPENTLAAFRLGYEQQADACELDIHLTKDGKLVVSHDATTDRTAGTKRRIAESPLAELAALEVGQWGGWRGKGFSETLPTLAAVFKLVPANHKLVIEIKCGIEALPELERVLAASQLKPEQIVLIGFDRDILRAAKARMPQHVALWLVTADKTTKEYPPLATLIEKARAAGLDGLDLHHGFPIDKAFVAQVRAAGMKLYTWTVDDPVVARAEKEAGVEAITTNRPQWLREQVGP